MRRQTCSRSIAGNPRFFLSFSIASAKAISNAASREGQTGLRAAIFANSRSLGVRMSGLGGRSTWPSAPMGTPRSLFPGYALDDIAQQ